jgi:hypothetical protein
MFGTVVDDDPEANEEVDGEEFARDEEDEEEKEIERRGISEEARL